LEKIIRWWGGGLQTDATSEKYVEKNGKYNKIMETKRVS
jgi:hypothetical protein